MPSLFTVRKMKFSITDFFSKCDQIRRKLRIWSHLLKKSIMENFVFCVVLLRKLSTDNSCQNLYKNVYLKGRNFCGRNSCGKYFHGTYFCNFALKCRIKFCDFFQLRTNREIKFHNFFLIRTNRKNKSRKKIFFAGLQKQIPRF